MDGDFQGSKNMRSSKLTTKMPSASESPTTPTQTEKPHHYMSVTLPFCLIKVRLYIVLPRRVTIIDLFVDFVQVFERVSHPAMRTLPTTQMSATQAIHLFPLAFSEPEKKTPC